MRVPHKQALISGAGFAGLSTAYWLRRLGYAVTVVEAAPSLRTGGTAVNIREGTIEVVKRMGLFAEISANRLSLERWELKDANDVTQRSLVIRAPGAPQPDDDFEIERDVLLGLLFDLVKHDVQFVFGERIAALHETGDGVEVTFARRAPETFDLVFGCDGMHSSVRRLVFGAEAQFTHFLQQYFSITIVDTLLIERNTAQLFNVPGKAVMLNAYKNRTDVIFGFVSEQELPYDRRDEAQQRQLIARQFEGVGWRTRELLAEVARSNSFYFDQLAQVRMPAWSRGRVVLVGDSAYCPSPAAGMGGSMALDGAAALADAMAQHPDDFTRAFRVYDETLRPFVERVQAEAVRTGLETLVPRTEEAIRARNERRDGGF